MYYFLLGLYIVSCFVLILFVLLQPGKSSAADVFGGGGANSAAFGPRGTQTVLAKVTIGAAIIFFLTAFLFSIPGLFDERSVGESVTSEPAVTAPAPAPVEQPPPTDPNAQPAVTPPPSDQGSQQPDQDGNK